MDQFLSQIEQYRKEVTDFKNGDLKAVEEFRIKWLGTKGIVKNLMGEIRNVPSERKKQFGQILNEFKVLVENKFEELKQATGDQPQESSTLMDLSLPGDPFPVGSRHPVSLMRNRIVSIFQRLGFAEYA